jgi:hypothetical protein
MFPTFNIMWHPGALPEVGERRDNVARCMKKATGAFLLPPAGIK